MVVLKNMNPEKAMKYFMKDDNMAGRTLDFCFENSRWGSIISVMYETDIRGLINFVTNWMKQNEYDFPGLFYSKDLSYGNLELPYINEKNCPRKSNHSGKIVDLFGLTRCAEVMEKRLKPSYVWKTNSFDTYSQTRRVEYGEEIIQDPVPIDAWKEDGTLNKLWREENERYEKELEKFDSEEPTFAVKSVCLAILSDKGTVLPLETVIKRLELSNGAHSVSEFPFDGGALAAYVEKWYQQIPEKFGKLPPLYEAEASCKSI